MKDLIKTAGRMILDGKAAVHDKEGTANYVTDRDVEIQRFLIAELSSRFPGCTFFGEEDTEGNQHNTSGHCFFIDPIDGTTNYIFGYNHSCVSVGESLDGKMVAGYVYNPFTDDFYYARRGRGASLNGRQLKLENRRLAEGITAFGCARYNTQDTDAIFDISKQLYLRSLSLRNGGSAALDLCRVASGANVLYLELMLQPYDYAAASVIIEEAGGVICRVDGSLLTFNTGCSVLAGTPKAVAEAKEIMSHLGTDTI